MDLVEGRFRVGELLGKGATAAVFRAVDEVTGTPVALKFFEDREGIADVRERFIQEAKMLSRVSSPFVIDVIAAGMHGDQPYLALELIEGTDLQERLLAEGKLAPDEVSRLTQGVLRGLAALHAAGITHRDLKPANVLLDAKDQPKISDLGLARGLGSAVETQAGVFLGTPGFIAPEVLKGGAASAPADMYAAGVMAYVLATGRLPFKGEDAGAIFMAQAEGIPPHRLARLPPTLRELVTALTAMDPAMRPSPGAALAILKGRGTTTGVRAAATRMMHVDEFRGAGGAGATGQHRTMALATPPRRGLPWWAPSAATLLACLLGGYLLAGDPAPPPPPPPPAPEDPGAQRGRADLEALREVRLAGELQRFLESEGITDPEDLYPSDGREPPRAVRDRYAEWIRERPWYRAYRRLAATPGGLGAIFAAEPDPARRFELRRTALRDLGDLWRLGLAADCLEAGPEVIEGFQGLVRPFLSWRHAREKPGRVRAEPGLRALYEDCRFVSGNAGIAGDVARFMPGIVGPPPSCEGRLDRLNPAASVHFDLGDEAPLEGEGLRIDLGLFSMHAWHSVNVAVLTGDDRVLAEVPVGLGRRHLFHEPGAGRAGIAPPARLEVRVAAALLGGRARRLRLRFRNFRRLFLPAHLSGQILAGLAVTRVAE